MKLFLIHGGLHDAMDAERFWRTPGIVAGLEARGFAVVAPDRPREPATWEVERLVLAWPATGGDEVVDGRTRAGLLARGTSAVVVDALLAGETLRGLRDEELARLGIPVAVLPSVPENPSHQRKTVDSLLTLIPGCTELAGSPEPPMPAFPPHKDELVATLASWVNR